MHLKGYLLIKDNRCRTMWVKPLLWYEISFFRNRVHSTLRSKRLRGISYAVRFLTARKFGQDAPLPNFRRSKKKNTRKTSRKTFFTHPESEIFHVPSSLPDNANILPSIAQALILLRKRPCNWNPRYLGRKTNVRPGWRTELQCTKVEETSLRVKLKRFC